MDGDYRTENAQALARLRHIVDTLTDETLGQCLPNGWTVADTLVHLAFWDFREVIVLERWQRDGVGHSPVDAPIINGAVQRLGHVIPGRVAAQLAVEAAEAVDCMVEDLSPVVVAQIEAAGKIRALRRALHRGEHLDQIEQELRDKNNRLRA